MIDIEVIKDIKKDLSSLDHQIEGAAYMINEDSPHRNFLNYLQRCLRGMHDKIGFELKINKNNMPNCS